MMNSPNRLLSEFAETRSEAAFRELVRGHFDLVYATALRQLGGDAHAAQDVAQEVFLLLAKKAGRLPKNVAVGGWLYRQACRRAINSVRGDVRRRRREAESVAGFPAGSLYDSPWEDVAPELDAAMLSLPTVDRAAVVLRFLEGRSHRAVGDELGISEEAARKRVGRAIESLRARLIRRGVASSSVSVLGSILVNAVTSSPAGAAEAVSLASTEAALAGSGVVFFQLPALLGGCLVGLIVTGVTFAARPKEVPVPSGLHQSKAPLSALVKRADQTLGWRRPLRENLSLEQILEEIRTLRGEPQHALSRLRGWLAA